MTLNLSNGQIPFVGRPTARGDRPGGGDGATPTPGSLEHRDHRAGARSFPGSIVYAKAGNIWIQTGKEARQLTKAGTDAMPTFSADGQWIYFIRVNTTRGRFPSRRLPEPAVVRPRDARL